ncbi:hypothetical protein K438DRAFT_1966650 [Mycena galopus ATCC 62051]|nr:hypothetical protein K438DRAFT_1966650 [Mycena galopus ATCC 62051]
MPPPNADTRSSADQQYLDSLTARQLMDFRDYFFTPTYISLNAGKFLDDKWVKPHRSGDVKMHALTEDGHEILELLSDLDAKEDLNLNLEVIEALRRTSRSSSVIAPSIPDSTVDDDLDGDIGGGHPMTGFADFPEGDRPAENNFSPADNFPLVESDTIWKDGSKSFVRDTGVSRPTRSVTVDGWTKKFKDNHGTHAIPDHFDEHLFIKALAGRPMARASCTAA